MEKPFVKGLLTPSALSMGVMMGVFFSLVLAFIVYVSQFSVSEGYWIARPDDDYANLFRIATTLELESQREKVIVIGSSAMREAILSPEHLRDNLREQKQEVLLRLCTAGDLSLIEMGQIISLLPADSQGLLILEISKRNLASSPSNMQKQVNHARLPMAPWKYQKTLYAQGLMPPIVPNYMSFFVARIRNFPKISVPKVGWHYHQIDAMPPVPEEAWGRLQKKIEIWAADSLENHLWNRAFYERLIAMVPKDLSVVLLEVPRNPDLVEQALLSEEYQAAERVYLEDMAYLQNTYNIEYWNVHSNIQGDNYADYGHINKVSGRREFTEQLTYQIKRLWSQK